jgi:hypothetical protein
MVECKFDFESRKISPPVVFNTFIGTFDPTTNNRDNKPVPVVPALRESLRVAVSGTGTTETVYRHQIRPVIIHGASVMDDIFKPTGH